MNKTLLVLVCVFLAIMFSLSCHNKTAPPSLSGKLLFEQNCIRCHGANGTAGINNAANLQLSRADTISIIHIVHQGRNGMPSFEGVLKDSEIQKITGYIYTLRK